MEIKASVDVGSNIAQLLEKLASHAGTTADKIFPWYVQMQQVSAIGNLAIMVVALVICVSILYVSCKYPWFDDQNKAPTFPGVVSCIALLFLFIVIVVGLYSTSTWIAKIVSPQYYAMQALSRDIARMVK